MHNSFKYNLKRLSWYYLKSFCTSPVACVSYFSKHGFQSLPCSPRTISRKQEDTDGQGTVSSLILCEISIEDHFSQSERLGFFFVCSQGKRKQHLDNSEKLFPFSFPADTLSYHSLVFEMLCKRPAPVTGE